LHSHQESVAILQTFSCLRKVSLQTQGTHNMSNANAHDTSFVPLRNSFFIQLLCYYEQ